MCRIVREASDRIDFCVIAAELAPELRGLVHRWIRVRIPALPFPAESAAFWSRAGIVLRTVEVDLVHTVGAIVPNRVDVSTIQFCHAGFVANTGGFGPREARSSASKHPDVSIFGFTCGTVKLSACQASAFGAVSAGVAEELREHYPGIKCSITPNGVDLARFIQNLKLERRSVAPWALAQQAFRGLRWRGLERKGLEIAISALGQGRSADVDMEILGSGSRRSS